MSERRLREAERRWQREGTLDAAAALLRERTRAGTLNEARLRVGAHAGNGACRLALNAPPPREAPVRSPPQLEAWGHELHRLAADPALASARLAEHLAVDAAEQALRAWARAWNSDYTLGRALRVLRASLERADDSDLAAELAQQRVAVAEARERALQAAATAHVGNGEPSLEDEDAVRAAELVEAALEARSEDGPAPLARALRLAARLHGSETTRWRLGVRLAARALGIEPRDPLARLGGEEPVRIALAFLTPAPFPPFFLERSFGRLPETARSAYDLHIEREPLQLPGGDERIAAATSLEALRRLRRQRAWPEERFAALITARSDAQDWFARHAEAHPRDAVIHADRFVLRSIRVSPGIYVAYYVFKKVLDGYLAEEGAGLRHEELTGCLWDMCRRKEELNLKLRAGFICRSCRRRLQESAVPTAFLEAMDAMLALGREDAIAMS